MINKKSFLHFFIISTLLTSSFNSFSMAPETELNFSNKGQKVRVAPGLSRAKKLAAIGGALLVTATVTTGGLVTYHQTNSGLSSNSTFPPANLSMGENLSTTYYNASETMPHWTVAVRPWISRKWCQREGRKESNHYVGQAGTLCKGDREDFLRDYYQRSSQSQELRPDYENLMVYFLNDQVNHRLNTTGVEYVYRQMTRDGRESVIISTEKSQSIRLALSLWGVEQSKLQNNKDYMSLLQSQVFHKTNAAIQTFIDSLQQQNGVTQAQQRVTETGQERSQRLSQEHRRTRRETWGETLSRMWRS